MKRCQITLNRLVERLVTVVARMYVSGSGSGISSGSSSSFLHIRRMRHQRFLVESHFCSNEEANTI